MSGAPGHDRRARHALAAIMAIAAIVRFWGVWFGLPLTQARPDESVVNGIALRFLSGDLHPHFFDYPTLFMYVLSGLYWVYYLVGRAAGWFLSVQHFMAQWDQAWSAFYLIGRCFAAALGTATVFVVYKLADRLFGSRVALLAGLFLALSFLHVRDSHFGVTDVPVTFLICASMLAMVTGHLARDSRSFFVAGLLAGLAASVKYNAVLLFVPLAVSYALTIAGSDRRRLAWCDTRVPLFGAGCLVMFLLGTPYALLAPHELIEGFRRVSAHLEHGHGIDLGPGWVYHLRVSLRYGVGWPVLAAALAGMVILAWRDRAIALLLWSFPIAYYFAAGSGRTVFIRYIILVLPFVCIAAALAVDAAARRIAHSLRRIAFSSAFTAAVLAVFLIIPSAVNVVRADLLLGRKDARLLVTDWLNERVPRGASLYQTDASYGRLELEDPGHRAWYETWEFDSTRGVFVRGDMPQPGGPEWIVIQRSQLLLYSRVPAPVEATVAAGDYVRVRSVTGTDLGAAGNVYDQQDAFFLPIAGFRGVRRPGPNFDVYQRRAPSTAVR